MRAVLVVLLVLGLLAPPLTGDAQQRSKMWRVGFLSGGAQTPDGGPPPVLRQALRDLGYVEQQNVVYVARWADAKQDRLPALAAELVELKVDVIVRRAARPPPHPERPRRSPSSWPPSGMPMASA
jgi:putative ABC transport system substrate-binding protein